MPLVPCCQLYDLFWRVGTICPIFLHLVACSTHCIHLYVLHRHACCIEKPVSFLKWQWSKERTQPVLLSFCILGCRKSEHEIYMNLWLYDFVMISEVMYHRAYSDAFHWVDCSSFTPFCFFWTLINVEKAALWMHGMCFWWICSSSFRARTWHGGLWKVWDADSGNLDCRLMGHIGTVAGPDRGKLAKTCRSIAEVLRIIQMSYECYHQFSAFDIITWNRLSESTAFEGDDCSSLPDKFRTSSYRWWGAHMPSQLMTFLS